MTVEFWLSKQYEYPHESEAVRRFLENMLEFFRDDPEPYWVLGNLTIPGAPIDLAVIKRNGIVIMELKDLDKPVRGGEEGVWYTRESDGTHRKIEAGQKKNPFQQVRSYRTELTAFLKRHTHEFLETNRAKKIDLGQIHAHVVFSPAMPEGTDIEIPVGRHPLKWWYGVVGLDKIGRASCRERV